MYQFCSLYSGSSGNATFIGNEQGGILVDIGKNAKQTTLALESIGISPEQIQGVFVTHEHSDHVAGLNVFCKRHKIPVYASLGTLEALDDSGKLAGDFPIYQMFDVADVGDFHISCFHTSHDCAEGLGYRISLPNGKNVAVATDTGFITDEVREGILGCTAVLLESNHDIAMLENGPYPYPLKRRILGERGHLSNDAAADMACNLIEGGTTRLLLGHLSKENNIPELAYQTSLAALLGIGAKAETDFTLGVADRNAVTLVEV